MALLPDSTHVRPHLASPSLRCIGPRARPGIFAGLSGSMELCESRDPVCVLLNTPLPSPARPHPVLFHRERSDHSVKVCRSLSKGLSTQRPPCRVSKESQTLGHVGRQFCLHLDQREIE